MTTEETELIRRCLEYWADAETGQYNEYGCGLVKKIGDEAVFRINNPTADFFTLCKLAGVRPVVVSKYNGNFCHIEFREKGG